MKSKKLMLLLICLLVLAAPMAAFSIPGYQHNPTNEQNQSSITGDVATTAAAASLETVQNRITGLTGPGGQSGQSSGNGPAGIGVWAFGGGIYLDSSRDGARYDGGLMTAMVGVDKQLGDLLFGVAFGVESLNLSTKYNSGKILYDGFSITPYLSYAFKKDLVADASFSYSWLGYTMKDTQIGTKYNDHMDADRRVASLGLTQYLSLDKLLLSGRIGTLYLDEQQGSYNLRNTIYSPADVYVWQGSLGLRGTYDLGAFKPTLGLTYSQDFIKSGGRTQDQDLWGVDLDLGCNYAVSDRFQLGLSGVFGLRENLTKAGGLLSLRYDF